MWHAGPGVRSLRLQVGLGIKGGPRVPLCPSPPQAAYLQRLGVNTAVFERRHVIGGAAVTEEIIPGEP